MGAKFPGSRLTRTTGPDGVPVRASYRRSFGAKGASGLFGWTLTIRSRPPRPKRASTNLSNPGRSGAGVDLADDLPGGDVEEPHARGVASALPRDREQPAVGGEVELVDRPVRRHGPAEAPARAGVEQHHRPVEAPDGEDPAVGAQRHAGGPGLGALHHAHRTRVAHERREQVAARRDGVVDHAPRLCEQQAALQAVLDEGLGAEALRVRDPGGVARIAVLPQREQTGDHREHEQDAGSGEQRPEAAVGAALAVGVVLRRRDARVEERALRRVEPGGVLLRPLHGGVEPGAAVEVAGLAPRCVPAAGRVAELAVQADAGAVLLEPSPQRRPLADEHLVGDLGGVLAEGQQARLGEPVEQRLDVLARAALRDELLDADAPAGVLDPLAELGQADEDVAQEPVVGRPARTRRRRPRSGRPPTPRRRSRDSPRRSSCARRGAPR